MKTHTQTSMKMHIPRISLVAVSLFLPATLLGQATWTGGAGPSEKDWNAAGFDNWSGNTNPAGQNVEFTDIGAGASAADATNIVSQNYSINSLTYTFEDADLWHVTEINAGSTITVGGTSNVFTVGGLNDNYLQTTNVAIRGAGALEINQSGGFIRIGNNHRTSSVPSVAILDMSDLESFSVSLGVGGTIDIGGAPQSITSAFNASQATVHLGKNNQITAGNFRVSARANTGHTNLLNPLAYSPTTLHLGETNEINANNFFIGGSSDQNDSANGRVVFADDVHDQGATLVLRGASGDKVTSMRIGSTLNFEGGANTPAQHGIVDLTGGSVDAEVATLVLGSAASSANSASGTLSMDAGIFLADVMLLGGGYSTGTGFGEGVLNISGGSFEAGIAYLAMQSRTTHSSMGTGVTTGTINLSGTGHFSANEMIFARNARDSEFNTHALLGQFLISDEATAAVANGIIMGQHLGSVNSSPLTATISITGGSLTVGGDIAEGALAVGGSITSTVEVKGGGLDMNGNEIRVDHFITESGSVSNIGGIGMGDGLIKTSSGTLLLQGHNSYTGTTQVAEGVLELHGSLTQGNVFVDDGAAFSLVSTGTLTMNIESETVSDKFTLASGATASFAGGLVFNLASQDVSNSWFLFEGTSAGNFDSLSQVELSGAYSASMFKTDSFLWSGNVDDHQFTFDTNSGTLSLYIIPEPSSASMLLLVVLTGLALKGRRRFSTGKAS